MLCQSTSQRDTDMKNSNASREVQIRKVCSKWVPAKDSFPYRSHGTGRWHFSRIFRILNACQSFSLSVPVLLREPPALQQVATDSDLVTRFSLLSTGNTVCCCWGGWLLHIHPADSSWRAMTCSPLPDSLPGCPSGLLWPWHMPSRSGATWPDVVLWSGGSPKAGLLFNLQT